jgi:predicted nucleic acid-binding protein
MSYLVETAVLVEALRPSRDVWVGRWLARHSTDTLYITAMSLATLESGAAALPPGPQRNLVTDWARAVAKRFDGRVLGFEPECAAPCAKVQARGLAAGQSVPMLAAMTCAIAERYGLILAARPAPHLALWGGPAVDPWQPMPLAEPSAVAAQAAAAALLAQSADLSDHNDL